MNTPQSVFDYYQKKLSCDGHIGASIYEIWEKGGSYLDSVTPSTYCLDYRNAMVERLMDAIGSDTTKRVLSLGCGNAFVEAELVQRGIDVFAIDINREAVELALAKQVPAAEVDFFDLQLADGRPYDLIYADGFFGHLYNMLDGCKHVLLKARALLSPTGQIVISNDGPSDDSPVQAHKSVPDFFYLSTQFLKQEGEACGFVANELINYGYSRPLSGPRTRSIATLSVARTV
ncbi:class I SAM-dependent methyltransferase [Trinickia dinghuensis]|uniref:Methyltransferase domain-containing protein n=1 Tax=Trinickia dinghuensis TaxID=2291023 RepID=A0A3D8K5Z7_9BURK|nr:methyltransferase domain-containing protein [Trinickia dinghuensis]RDV00650.1 methyltransferase domain-containing protein [Trinickia dinghuensis]